MAILFHPSVCNQVPGNAQDLDESNPQVDVVVRIK